MLNMYVCAGSNLPLIKESADIRRETEKSLFYF